MAKRQRELDQKDRVKEREKRLTERQARTEARKNGTEVSTGVDEILFDEEGRPIVARNEDGMPIA